MSSHRHPKLLGLALLFASLLVVAPASAQWATTFIPIAGLPTEDVDMVELTPQPIGLPPTIVYPTESAVYYIDMTTDAVYATVAKPGPNISGVDYYSSPDGKIGVMPVLGQLCVFNHGPGVPSLFLTIPLPGTPARRDIDVTIVPGLVNPWDAIYATGTEIHRIDLTTGAFWWTTPVPTPIVEAVDPLYVPTTGFGFPVVFAATDGFMTEIDAITGAILPGTPIATGTTVIREVDIRLNPAGTLVFFHGNFVLDAFSTATGALVASTPLASMGIEGNDIEWDNTGTRGVAITVANMVWFNAGTGGVTDIIPFFGWGHQRNQDLITTAPGIAPQMAGYQAQGAFFIYTVPALPAAIGLFAINALPSPTMDGVDPVTTDVLPGPSFPPGPPGVIALAPTQGFISEVDLRGGGLISMAMAPGVLRMDVDVRRGGTGGNKNYQPYVGGVVAISGLIPGEYTITVSTGVQVLNVAGFAWLGFIPTGMIFRGGDEQVTTLLGPAVPSYTTDTPDQDFLTKCWEYKYTMNRWPMWYSISNPLWYPHFMPYGVFGPPALMGWDIWNDWKVMVLNNQSVALLDRQGLLRQVIPLPSRPIGGLVWDWDNKLCKLRLYGQQEVIIDLSRVYSTGLASVTYVPYTVRTEWYPIVDRMNGWEFVVARGARRIWVYDHIVNGFVTWIDLPARIIRPPILDEQRKTLCCPLADRRVFFFNAYKYRLTSDLTVASTYSPVLPALVCADPVFDIYNHYTLCRLYGGSIVVLDNSSGALLYNTGLLPYWPIGPIQIDCYNKVAKWNAYNGVDYAENWMYLYPMVTGGLPLIHTISLGPAAPFGYPLFDSRDGWEFTRIANVIRYDYLFSPYTTLSYTYPGPFVLTGNLFIDRVNKYGLCATTGTHLLWLNLFRLTKGLAGATTIISLPSPATQGIHFLTQLHLAVVQLQSGQIAVINTADGTLTTILGGIPPCQRQIYVQPFTGLCNYSYWSGSQGYDVTIDLNPLRQNPPASPLTHVELLPAPTNEAANFIPPPAVGPVSQLGYQIGDDTGPQLHHFLVPPGSGMPGANYLVDNGSTRNKASQMDPVSGTFEDDGSSQFTALANPGENVCIRVYDPEGNASGEVCVVATATLGVEPNGPTQFALAMTSANPLRDRARFHFALPTHSHVELAIYDMSGRRISSLVSQDREQGEYDEAWDLTTAAGTRAAPGVYFAKFNAGTFKRTMRVVVLK